jgi:acyl-CoA thioester hydrolase
MSNKVFRHLHRITYSECTVGNHVYHSRYLDILEGARGEFFRQIGHPFLHWQKNDTLFPVIECRLRYRGAARYDDVLTIELWLTDLSRIRLNFAYRIANPSAQILLEATTIHACTTAEEKLKRLPEDFAAALRAYLHQASGEELT